MTHKSMKWVSAILIGACVAAPAFAILGLGDIVFDPSNFEEAVQQLLQMEQQYVQLVQTYQMVRNQYEHLRAMAQQVPVNMAFVKGARSCKGEAAYTREEAKQLFETNFFGVLRMSQAVLPIMRGQRYGRIANVSSVVGFVPAPYQGIYGASKHALEGYSESLDHEVRQFGIRVSVIEPGFTRTKISQNSQVAGRLLEAYESERNRVLDAVRENTASGENSFTAASAVLEALTARSPRARYPVGQEAKLLSRFRKLIPSKLFDKSLRKQFGLGAA